MPRRSPMPARERAVCRRLREFREWTGLSQAELCALVGINHRTYASYEYERSQLNYSSARKILSAIPLLNPIWLAEGTGNMLQGRLYKYPEAGLFGLRTPYSRVYDDALRAPLATAPTGQLLRPVSGLRLFTYSTDAAGRMFSKERFGSILFNWLAALPDESVNDFLNLLFRRAAQVAARYPRDVETAVTAREAEMYAIEEQRRAENKRNMLTEPSTPGKLPTVKSQLKNLLARVNRIAEQPGKMSELADSLGAPLASVSRWLSGKREPGGETTLQLLHWVEQQERK